MFVNIKRRERETLNVCFRCFKVEVPKRRKVSNATLKNFLIIGVKLVTNYWIKF